jgi:hypothetical protein
MLGRRTRALRGDALTHAHTSANRHQAGSDCGGADDGGADDGGATGRLERATLSRSARTLCGELRVAMMVSTIGSDSMSSMVGSTFFNHFIRYD